MTPLDRVRQLELVAEANRAPSVHNLQPARWRFTADNEVILFEDSRRRLTIGDPTGRDSRISLGAAFEGLHLALSKKGLGLQDPQILDASARHPSDPPHLARVAQTVLGPVADVDPLFAVVYRRHTFRRPFERADHMTTLHLRRLCSALPDIVPVFGGADIQDLAGLNDRCTYEFLDQPDYLRELYHWMRFSARHPHWHRDGLTGPCLGLSPIERRAASLLLRPRVFTLVKLLQLGRLLTSETAKTRTASAILIFTADAREDPFLTGRRFYRVWLEICREGFALCPMSALVDSIRGSVYLRDRYAIPEGLKIVSVFRVGIAPEHAVPLSPRLPAEELIV